MRGDPFSSPRCDEDVACFALDSETAQSIEPRPETYLGSLLFTGTKNTELQNGPNERGSEDCSIPRGLYLFGQIRSAPERELFTAMAIEVQKEGLWRRLDLKPVIFLRVLKEEDQLVTQVLRPLRGMPVQPQ